MSTVSDGAFFGKIKCGYIQGYIYPAGKHLGQRTVTTGK